MKKLICMILLISMLTLPSCAILNEGIFMPSIKTDQVFENETWLVVEDRLINKIDGTVYWLKPNGDAALPSGIAEFYYSHTVVYDCKFEESTVELHTILSACWVDGITPTYYECVLTFDYEGKEIDRVYVGSSFSREKAQELYQEKTHNIEAFSFCVLDGGYGHIHGRYTSIAKKDTSAEKQAILDFVENIHDEQNDGKYYTIDGLAKPMGDEIWFSVSGSNRLDSVKADPLISGIRETKIIAYNHETNEFRTVFEHDKKSAQIIDFDENRAYILDSNGELSYVDFETKESIAIYDEFSGIDHITVNDKYIFVEYQLNGYTYFVYEKGGSVVANDSSLD